MPSLRSGRARAGRVNRATRMAARRTGPGAQVDAGTMRRSWWTQKMRGTLDLSVRRQETAVQVVRLAKIQDVHKLAIARDQGLAGSFSVSKIAGLS